MATPLERLIRRNALVGGVIGACIVVGSVLLVQSCDRERMPPVATEGLEP